MPLNPACLPACLSPPAALRQVRATTTLVDPKKLKAEQERAEAERIRSREKLAERQTKTMRKFGLPAMPRARMPQQLNAGGLGLGSGGWAGAAMCENAGLQLGSCLITVVLHCAALPHPLPCASPSSSPPACCAPGPAADYLEEDEDQDEEEGMGEDLQEAQRQRMLGRARGAYDEDEEEAAARLAAAKSGAPAPGGKRRRIEEEEEEEELSAEEEEDEEEMKVCAGCWPALPSLPGDVPAGRIVHCFPFSSYKCAAPAH